MQTRRVRDYKGKDLVEGVLRLVDKHRPIHVSLVGGEPLVRFRELSVLLPQLEDRGIHIQIVTSAVRPIPLEWREVRNLNLVVSIDGLQPEHDERRKPATYERIFKNIEGHRITVHCTITRQMTDRADYLRDFVHFWSGKDEVRRIWMSLFTPQVGEVSSEMLPPESRESIIDMLFRLRREFPKLDMPEGVLEALRVPPRAPQSCLFARITRAVAADLEGIIHPCQLGGEPDCSQCGCMASAALGAIDRHPLLPGIRLGDIYSLSSQMGQWLRVVRLGGRGAAGAAEVPAGLVELVPD